MKAVLFSSTLNGQSALCYYGFMEEKKRVHILDPLVAQRIAAGEVIERPASVVRELIDNAVDAHARTITVQLVEGGLERITVIDDGDGIAVEDLPLCCQSHATSKVTILEDLYHLDTMGFRGEALYSIAACAKVTIASSQHGQEAFTMVVDNGKQGEITRGGPREGTRIDIQQLFATIPARRLFLKRPATESTMCRNTILEKAMAFPHITFRFHDGDKLKLDLPATTPKERVLQALAGDTHLVPGETTELSDTANRFSLYAVATTPACYRTDRSAIKVYINKRLIEDYALIQAVTYGYGEMLPGGSFPYCYLFITVDPELVDFNIHPAKREAKLRNKTEIHHQIVVMIKQQVSKSIPRLLMEHNQPVPRQFDFTPNQPSSTDGTLPNSTSFMAASDQNQTYRGHGHVENKNSHWNSNPAVSPDRPQDPQWFSKAREILKKQETGGTNPVPISPTQTVADLESTDHSWDPSIEEPIIYIGQAFDLFLIAQKGNTLYLIDQHAAHERILFDEIRSHGSIQRLMMPLQFEVERDVDGFLQKYSAWYGDYGLELSRTGDLEWELGTIPALWKTIEHDVVRFIGTQAGNIEELEKNLYATIACHSAIRNGDPMDTFSAQAIIQKVFAMEKPVCPHGRTFVIAITKDSLWKTVGRT